MLAPANVRVPAPILVRPPVPTIGPEKMVLVLSLPVVSIPLPSVTLPVPASEPIVWLKPPRSSVAPDETVNALDGAKALTAPPFNMPVLTVVGLQFGALLAGAIITETIFSWPGIGRLTVQAIGNRDYYLVQGCILMIGLTYVIVNFMTDFFYSLANPWIRQ